MAVGTGSTHPQTALALIKKDVVDVVAKKVEGFIAAGELHLPANYSPDNAMKAAWLILQETLDKDKKPVLTACSKDSIANALLDMVVQGLSPAKKQGYFIAYGSKLTFQRSYFGTAAVAMRALGCLEPRAEVVYQKDEFEYEITRTGKVVTKHSQKLENIDPKAITAAYCVIEWPGDKKPAYTEIMTMAQIKQSWKMSKMNPDAADSTHNKYPDQMAKRTVINRACKLLINATNDHDLVIETFNRTDQTIAEAELEEEAGLLANRDVIDIEAKVEEGDGVDEAPPEDSPEAGKQETDQKRKPSF